MFYIDEINVVYEVYRMELKAIDRNIWVNLSCRLNEIAVLINYAAFFFVGDLMEW